MQESAPARKTRAPFVNPVVFTDEELLDDLRQVATKLCTKRLSQADYESLGHHSTATLSRRFKSWTGALARIGVEPARRRNAGAAVVLEDIRRVARELRTKRLRLRDYLARGFYARRVIYRLFGVWHRAATAAGLTVDQKFEARTQGPRNIGLTLRYRVFSRDQYRCRLCGRSPATHPDITLEADHITPWSQGGRTALENLQTLCNQCNRGKSDTPQEPSPE